MKTSAASVEEALQWADLFSKFTGLSVIHSMSIYAELCFCWNTSKILQNILHMEEDLDDFYETHDIDEDEDAYWEAMDEIHSRYGVEYVDFMDDDEIKETYEHYRSVLKFHNLTDCCLDNLIESLNPIRDSGEWSLPSAISKSALWSAEFNPEPYYDKDPEEMDELEFGDVENAIRLARPMHPAGWLGVIRHLGFTVENETIDEDYELGKPSFYISDTLSPLPVFLAAPTRTPFSTDDVLCESIKQMIVEDNSADCMILFYSAPMSFSKGDTDEQIQFWGEILVNGDWYELVLRPESTTLDTIIADAISTSRGIEFLDWTRLSTKDQCLIEVWAKEDIDLLSEMFGSHQESLH